ncbi:hypothetical protein NW768_007689 [Fusarium equiseti]|uniref:CCHC-type domain-containing protein n=1 Tax=Fusarium equiseti TaxID=61235 RepID=A0ABQ8R882_FUSEQ|nr:hypothetical protein NW768_007689 [Fusarium equiseti]
MSLAGKIVNLKDGPYKLIASLRQARPMLCYNCGKPGHKAYQCTYKRCCPKCTEDHETGECTLTDPETFICPNCHTTGHGAFYPFCPYEASLEEHDRARRCRLQGPYWATINAAPKDHTRSTNSTSNAGPSSSVPPSSQDPPKRGRGRPSNAEKAERAEKRKRELENEGMDSNIFQQPSQEPSASKRAKHYDLKNMIRAMNQRSMANSKAAGESSSGAAASSSQGQRPSQETLGGSASSGGVSHGSSSAKNDGAKKNNQKNKAKANNKSIEKGKGKATENLPIRNPAQAVAKSHDDIGEAEGAIDNSTLHPSPGAVRNGKRVERRH